MKSFGSKLLTPTNSRAPAADQPERSRTLAAEVDIPET